MNRTDLIDVLANETELTKAAVGRVLDELIDTIQKTVKTGESVQLVGFGTFKSTKRPLRMGRNPRTGQAVQIPAATVPKFVAGVKFKAVVNSSSTKQ